LKNTASATGAFQNNNTMRKTITTLLLPLLFMGITLTATAQDDAEFGIASYYHESFDGNETAYGRIYDKDKLTAAHLLHPPDTKLRVTRLDNKKSVVVTVIDKGPYKRGRIIDLSTAAAKRLNLLQDGIAEVKVEVVSRGKSSSKSDERQSSNKTRQGSDERPSSYEQTSRVERITAADERRSAERSSEPVKERATASTSSSKKSQSASKGTSKASSSSEKGEVAPQLVGKNDYQKYGLYKIALFKPESKGYAVQVASLTNYENVFQQVADLQSKWFDNILISVEEGRLAPTYKIMLGPFEEEAAANNYRKNLQKKHKIKGFVVNLSEIEFTR
jgi:rare lipoprotein A